jgi:hypothetical protein
MDDKLALRLLVRLSQTNNCNSEKCIFLKLNCTIFWHCGPHPRVILVHVFYVQEYIKASLFVNNYQIENKKFIFIFIALF